MCITLQLRELKWKYIIHMLLKGSRVIYIHQNHTYAMPQNKGSSRVNIHVSQVYKSMRYNNKTYNMHNKGPTVRKGVSSGRRYEGAFPLSSALQNRPASATAEPGSQQRII